MPLADYPESVVFERNMLKIHNMMLGQHNDLLDQSLRCELLTGNQNFVRTSKTDSDQIVWMPRLI